VDAVLAFLDFTTASRRDADRAIVRFDGELDLANEGLARAEIEIALDRGGDELVLDLRGVSFLDARGVRVLLDARSACQARNRRLTVMPPPQPVQRVLHLCGLDGAFEQPVALAG